MSSRKKRRTTTDSSDSHFVQMMEWLAMEATAEIERLQERQRRRSDKDAEKSGETILDLAIFDQMSGLGGRVLVSFHKRNRTLPMPWHRLKAGSPVLVSPFKDSSGESLKGVVSAVDREQIQVAMDYLPEATNFRIDLTADEITRRRQLSAITHAMEARGRLGHLRKVTMGEVEPQFGELPDVDFKAALNASQQEAVKLALSAHDLAIIHGPPGTGKTTTVVELIVQAVERGEKVLACAPSNTAVDNLLERLIAARRKVVRLGHPARVAGDLRAFTLDGLVETHESADVIRDMYREAEQLFRRAGRFTRSKPGRGQKQEWRAEAKRLKRDAREMERRAVEHVLDRAEVVCATATFNDDILGDRWFDMLVIDEACQSVEPGCWVPLAFAEKVVLAGDQCQLPPTVISIEASRQGFDISLLERVNNLHGELTTRLLTEQYRMNTQIMDFSSSEFYEGRLVANETVADHLLSGLTGIASSDLTENPVQFIDTAGAGWDEELEPDGESRLNPREAEFAIYKSVQLIEAGLSPKDIAIIAPYAAQVRLLRTLSRENMLLSGIEIDTVDGFQGREKEAILISTVRSNPNGEIGFLGDRRRMNVALTRAKRKLIVTGDSATLGNHEFYTRMLEYFEKIGAYSTVWQEEFLNL
ncbi:MAG: AAA domain-containing protein [Planctomycetota bacterium]